MVQFQLRKSKLLAQKLLLFKFFCPQFWLFFLFLAHFLPFLPQIQLKNQFFGHFFSLKFFAHFFFFSTFRPKIDFFRAIKKKLPTFFHFCPNFDFINLIFQQFLQFLHQIYFDRTRIFELLLDVLGSWNLVRKLSLAWPK